MNRSVENEKKVNLKKIFAFAIYGIGILFIFPCFALFFNNLKIISSYDDEKIVGLAFGIGMLFVILVMSLCSLFSDFTRIARKFIIKKRLEKNVDKYIERKFG